MTETKCNIEGAIAEVDRLLAKGRADAAALEQRKEELEKQLAKLNDVVLVQIEEILKRDRYTNIVVKRISPDVIGYDVDGTGVGWNSIEEIYDLGWHVIEAVDRDNKTRIGVSLRKN